MALNLNLNTQNKQNADFFSVIKIYVYFLCKWIAIENFCQKFYSFKRKSKQYLILNFDLSLSSFTVKYCIVPNISNHYKD